MHVLDTSIHYLWEPFPPAPEYAEAISKIFNATALARRMKTKRAQPKTGG